MLERFQSLLSEIIETRIPDLHITSGALPRIRKHTGELEDVTSFWVVAKSDVETIIRSIVGDDGWNRFAEEKELDVSHALGVNRFRVNVFEDVHGPGLAMRYIPVDIPTLEELSVPESIRDLLDRDRGLILITGPTGSGKSTTLAAMIEYINTKHKKHIITVEDPIEFNFVSKQCLIHQREVGTHTKSFPRAIKASLREDPDIVMVWEMRDPETMAAALTLAETGHLVFSTLHTNDTIQSIDRIIDAFPPTQQSQVRTQLSMALTAVMSQTLIPRSSWTGRVVAREVLINTDAVRSVVMRGVTHQLYSVLELSSQEGMILMDHSIQNLYKKGLITKESFESRIRDKDILAN